MDKDIVLVIVFVEENEKVLIDFNCIYGIIKIVDKLIKVDFKGDVKKDVLD